jgi:cyclopropane-fatty-acyl-phospholipid synthase
VLHGLRHLDLGCLTVILPDGSEQVFGSRDRASVLRAELRVHRWRFFSRLLRAADIGAGESYVDGDWSSPDLVVLTRLFLANEERLTPPFAVTWLRRTRDRLRHLVRTNTRMQARQNIHAHYDLSNDFYRLFLDDTMTYSAALFECPAMELEAAQRAKYRRLAEGAGLEAGDHVLEIGCGWGGFAEYAAGELGCRVTGITLSEKQAAFARRRMEARDLDNRVEIRVADYRDLDGTYDALVSIEMLEAVGHRYLDAYFAACSRLLSPQGRMALQTITIPDQIYDHYRRGIDWIRLYIFPGGHLPSLGAIQGALARQTSLVIERLEDIGDHYATTLSHWRRRFWGRVDEVRRLGFDERFVRLWDFYLATCEAAFRHHQIGDLQLVLARSGRSDFGQGTRDVGHRSRRATAPPRLGGAVGDAAHYWDPRSSARGARPGSGPQGRRVIRRDHAVAARRRRHGDGQRTALRAAGRVLPRGPGTLRQVLLRPVARGGR